MPSKTILDARLFVRLDLNSSLHHNLDFASDPAVRGHLARQLLLYDTVAIPTIDFGIVPILAEWLGEGLFREMLAAGAFRFVHRHGLLGYAGNGNSLSSFILRPGPDKPLLWWQEAMFRDSGVALERQIGSRLSWIGSSLQPVLMDAVLQKVTELDYDNNFFMKNVVKETYRDVLKSNALSNMVRAEFPGAHQIDLTRIPTVNPNQLRVLGKQGITDSVDLLLRVAELNLEIVAASYVGGADMYTADGSQELLRNKLARNNVGNDLIEGFVKLIDLHKLPDIGMAVATGQFPIGEVWRLRESSEAVRFREWMRNIQVSDPEDVTAAYIAAISREPRSASWPVRMIRLAVTTAIGSVGTATGLVASGIDSFFVDRFLGGYSPKLFFNKLERLGIPSSVPKPTPRVEVLDRR